MIEDLRTAEQEELDTIIDGLELQAEVLEDAAEDTKESAQFFGAMALLAAGATMTLNYFPEKWKYERDEITSLFAALALGTAIQLLRQRANIIKANRKRRLVDELQEEADLLEQLPVY